MLETKLLSKAAQLGDLEDCEGMGKEAGLRSEEGTEGKEYRY